MKRTYQPNRRKRAKTHGFRKRMSTVGRSEGDHGPAGERDGEAGRLTLLPKSKRTRLTDSPEFDRVYRQGLAYRGKLFSVHAFPNELGATRLGMSVSKKVGNAVTRNTVRRRIKEVFRATQPALLGDRDVVISARPAAAKATYGELEKEFLRSLYRLNGNQVQKKA